MEKHDHPTGQTSRRMVGHLFAAIRFFETLKSWRRADQQEERIVDSLRQVDEAYDFLKDPSVTGQLGASRLGTLEDARAAGLLDPAGLFLGALHGTPLIYSGGAHLLTYARTGAGKGRDVILPNLAYVRDQSVIVVDVKDGENAYAAAHHRQALGQQVILLNPWNLLKAGNTCVNPLARLTRLAAQNKRVEVVAREIALILVPSPKKASANEWVAKGAQRLIAIRLCFLAYYQPAACVLSSLWRFVNQGEVKLLTDLADMVTCDRDTISGQADAFFSLVTTAPKQWEAYRSEVQTALDAYEPGSELEASTLKDDFDPASLKQTPATVFLMVPSALLGVAAQWISLICNHLIESVAAAPGTVRTLFLLDEVAQLPVIPSLLKALRLYRGRGIQLWLFCQGRFSLQERYAPEIVKEIEDQADVFQMFMPEEPSLLRDIEIWSGKTSVAVRGINQGGGQVDHLSLGISEQTRPVLQVEDIRAVGHGRQILKLPSHPLFVAQRIAFYEIDPFKDQLGDVRDVANGDMALSLEVE